MPVNPLRSLLAIDFVSIDGKCICLECNSPLLILVSEWPKRRWQAVTMVTNCDPLVAVFLVVSVSVGQTGRPYLVTAIRWKLRLCSCKSDW